MLANELLGGFMKSETSLQENDDEELKLVKMQNCVLVTSNFSSLNISYIFQASH